MLFHPVGSRLMELSREVHRLKLYMVATKKRDLKTNSKIEKNFNFLKREYLCYISIILGCYLKVNKGLKK